jgi:hypothetical protein
MSKAAGHATSALFWAVAQVDIAQAAIKKRADRKKFEVMNKSGERPAGPFNVGLKKK